VAVASLTRHGYAAGDLACLMSPRTVITWAENCQIFRDPALAFRLSFLNNATRPSGPWWPSITSAVSMRNCWRRRHERPRRLHARTAGNG